MNFINDAAGELTNTSYRLVNGRIMLKIQCRSKAKGFLIAVSEVFAKGIPLENEQLQIKLKECIQKNGNNSTFTENNKEYRFFYINEEFVRSNGYEVPLPENVKTPVKIKVYWIDSDKNAHIEADMVSEVIAPIVVRVEVTPPKKKLISFKKEYPYEINISCPIVPEDDSCVIYYRVNRKENCYPIPKRMMRGGSFVIKAESDATEVRFGIFKEYEKMYELQQVTEARR